MTKIEVVRELIDRGNCAGSNLCGHCPLGDCVLIMQKRQMDLSYASAQTLLKEWLQEHMVEGKQRIFDFEG